MKFTSFAALLGLALAATGAFADETPPGPNQAHTPTTQTAYRHRATLMNGTSSCVRFYVEGRKYDLPTKSTPLDVDVWSNKSYMASIFNGSCKGQAARNVWFKGTNTRMKAR